MKTTRETRSLTGVTVEGSRLVGYIAKFDEPSEDLGGFTEYVRRGAFAKTLDRNILALLNHSHDLPLGSTQSGTLKLSEDHIGLKFELTIPDTQSGRDLRELVRTGVLTGCSFGFEVVSEEWDGEKRYLTEVILHEVSLGVAFPAYGSTEMHLRRKCQGIQKMRAYQSWLLREEFMES